MHPRDTILIISLLVFAICSACSRSTSKPANAATPSPSQSPKTISSANFVRVHIAHTQLPAGGSVNVEVSVSVQDGYHINANPATYSYLKATELSVQTGDGVSVGLISYPTPITKKFSFAEKLLAVYEDDATIKVTLNAESSTLKGERGLPATLNVQACDNQVCYPPGVIDFFLPVLIK